MPVTRACDNCGTVTPIYRLSGVLLDARTASLCPRCVSTLRDRIEIPYAPRVDQRAIQPSTSRDTW